MKKVSVREFYRNTGLVDRLPEGAAMAVTCKGKAKFIVTKSSRPKMTRELAQKRAIPSGTGKIDVNRFIRSLK